MKKIVVFTATLLCFFFPAAAQAQTASGALFSIYIGILAVLCALISLLAVVLLLLRRKNKPRK